MNYQNDNMLTAPHLSYTHRDFKSIYDELLKSIPLLTKSWQPADENDPGIVLIKMISMIGDMLSYNQDKMALEAFPRTVLQRANAQQLFRLVGYKMHWWRSAKVKVDFTNSNSISLNINKYNTFTNHNGSITYTNLQPIIIPSNARGVEKITAELIQGTPVTPNKIDIDFNIYNNEWHDLYDYNVDATNFNNNNRLYLNQLNIDETSIALIDDEDNTHSNNEWTLVDNINLSENMEKVFELNLSENGTLYIQLPSYWRTKYAISKFKLFYVLSNGDDGEIESNILNTISTDNCYIPNNNDVDLSEFLNGVTLTHQPSTYGYKPQTCAEARIDAEKYVNTLDTIITLNDFEKVIKRIDSVANVVATDIQTDPYAADMTNDQVNLYIVRKNNYNNLGSNGIYVDESTTDSEIDDVFKKNILDELKSHKTIPTSVNIFLETRIDWIEWTISGSITLRKPIDSNQNEILLTNINTNLKNRFNSEQLSFNEPINYLDVIECIMNTDNNILYVDLDGGGINYYKAKRTLYGEKTGYSINHKYKIYDSNGNYTGYYANSLGVHRLEINKILPYDSYFSNEDGYPGYIAGTGSIDITNKLTSIDKVGDNKIINESGNKFVNGLFGESGTREYEIYGGRIYDWSGSTPIFTGYIITYNDNSYIIEKYDEFGILQPQMTIEVDSRMYDSTGTALNKILRAGYRQIDTLCDIRSEDDILTDDVIANLTQTEIANYLSRNIIREVWDIYTFSDGELTWTNDSVDQLTREIFTRRGAYWYSQHKAYAENGDIVFTDGKVYYDSQFGIVREPVSTESLTGEYIHNDFDVGENDKKDYKFFLGQDVNGNQLVDSIGNPIEGKPIKPYSLFIYIDDENNIISDNGSGNLVSTKNVLNGLGSINYATGEVNFSLLKHPEKMKIVYKINKLTMANYLQFNTKSFFVKPQYLKSNG